MQTSYQKLAKLLAADPGRRRVPALSCPKALADATAALLAARKVVLCSGFYIGRADAWETDGPLGTLILAMALQELGIATILLTDAGAVPIFKAGLRSLGFKVPLYGFAANKTPAVSELLRHEPDAVVAIERCGQAADGGYYNANGADVKMQVAHFDALFTAANERNITTIAIGDGGNELGFGARLPEVETLLGDAKQIACVTAAKHLIACGVSNWGAYALAALLAHYGRVPLRCTEAMLAAALTDMVAAGAVDGISGLGTPTVDGLPLAVELAMFTQLKHDLQLPTKVVGESGS